MLRKLLGWLRPSSKPVPSCTSMQALTGGAHFIKLYVEAHFPNVEDFEVDHRPISIEPIKYFDGWRDRNEYPPVFSWRVGNVWWKFAPEPNIRRGIHPETMWSYPRSYEMPEYEGRPTNDLIEVVKLSSEGKTPDEVNRIMRFKPPSWLPTRRY